MVVDRQLGLVTVLGSQVREVNLEGTWLGDTKQRPQLEEAEDGAFTAGWQHSLQAGSILCFLLSFLLPRHGLGCQASRGQVSPISYGLSSSWASD